MISGLRIPNDPTTAPVTIPAVTPVNTPKQERNIPSRESLEQ